METASETHNQSTHRVVETSPNGYICKTLPHLRLRNMWKRAERMTKSKDPKFCCKIVSPSIIGNYTHKVSLSWLPEDTNEPTWQTVRGKAHNASAPCKDLRATIKLGHEKWPSLGKNTLMVVQCQMVSPEKHIYKYHFIDSMGYIWEYICIYIYAFNNSWEAIALKETAGAKWEGLNGRGLDRGKGRRNCNWNIISKANK